MAEALLNTVLGKLAEEGTPAYEVLETYVGKDLEYKEYEPLYQCAADNAEKQYEVCVTTGSDAHIDVDAGNFSYIKEVLEFCKFPEELVVTTDFNKLKEFLNNYKES